MSASIKNYLLLEQEIEKITHLGNISMIAHWDMATHLPSLSHVSRSQEMATLSCLIHEMSVSDKIKDLIEASHGEIENLDPWQRANLNLVKKKSNEMLLCSAS